MLCAVPLQLSLLFAGFSAKISPSVASFCQRITADNHEQKNKKKQQIGPHP